MDSFFCFIYPVRHKYIIYFCFYMAGSISYIQLGDGESHPIDAVTVGGKDVPDLTNVLPVVSSSDNGKVLRVINGQWALVNPAMIYSGEGEPSNDTGNNGDIYIQTITGV